MVGRIARWLRDEEAAGSNPATPTTKPQATRYPLIWSSRSAHAGVRFREPNGSGVGALCPTRRGPSGMTTVDIADIEAALGKVRTFICEDDGQDQALSEYILLPTAKLVAPRSVRARRFVSTCQRLKADEAAPGRSTR